jgi:hypothetical protein
MTKIQQFLWGFLGSLAVEALDLNEAFHARQFRIPARCRSVFYWVVRISMALFGGMLAIAYNVQSPILAMNIGATVHLLIRVLQRSHDDGQGQRAGKADQVIPIRIPPRKRAIQGQPSHGDDNIQEPAA